MIGADLGVARRAGLVLRATTTLRARGVNRLKPWLGSRSAGSPGVLGHEALLRGLLGDAHAAADVGPGRPGAAGLVDEVADQVVGDLAEVVRGETAPDSWSSASECTFLIASIRSSSRTGLATDGFLIRQP